MKKKLPSLLDGKRCRRPIHLGPYRKARKLLPDFRPNPLRTDWPKVIADLNGCGYSTRKIGRTLGVNESTVRAWKRCEPGFDSGYELIEMWLEATGKARNELPRRPTDGRIAGPEPEQK